jgi:hypothetical protein
MRADWERFIEVNRNPGNLAHVVYLAVSVRMNRYDLPRLINETRTRRAE